MIAGFPGSGKIAGVAQLVEQRIRNAKVEGSTPFTGTSIFEGSADSRPLTLFHLMAAPGQEQRGALHRESVGRRKFALALAEPFCKLPERGAP
jgi:hypothetical protein